MPSTSVQRRLEVLVGDQLVGHLVHTREGIGHDELAELFDKSVVTPNVVIALGRGRMKAYVDRVSGR